MGGDRRVVVTGLGIISPLGLDASSTWRALLEGRSGAGPITQFDASALETRIAAEVKGFDPLAYLDRREARRTDRFVQFAVAAAQEAVRQAGLDTEGDRSRSLGVVIGTNLGGVLTLCSQFAVMQEKGPGRVSPFLIPMVQADMAASEVAMRLGARGPSYSIISACASGADAIGEGYHLLRRGEVEAVLCGGAEAPICPLVVAGFNACGALSRRNEEPHRASRPFDAGRDGFLLGEGSAVLVLETLEGALRRGVRPLAEVIGYAATEDAYHITQPAPEGAGLAEAMRLALQRAGLPPEAVDYINAHGTSTPLNDRTETQAIKRVFGERAYRIPISSTKSMTGHLLGAAGALEAALCVLALREGVIPPTINLETPDPECDLDYTPWTPRQADLQVALTNSAGFGGHNASLLFRRFEE